MIDEEPDEDRGDEIPESDDLDRMEHELHELEQRLRGFIRERPWVCVLGAIGLGYVAGRLLRRDR